MKREKALILIVDDQEMNRALLSDMLETDYEIMEARDGVEAMQLMESRSAEIASVLLDIRMPNMDGFEVLSRMKYDKQLEQIPVIMISNDDSPESVERSYALGAADYINRPFNNYIVKKRVENTIFLYQKTKTLTELVEEQVAEKEKNNANMITVLSAIVEFRNGESGNHTLRIRIITEILLEHMMRKYPKYHLDFSAIADISNAAALHDIGKIAIPEEVLNKPGKLTKEEFEIMKTHSAQGAEMLDKMKDLIAHNPMFNYARQICRWHHERFDGRGYPDGLVGDSIPICAQVVSLADVYDALTSVRVYKPAYSHEKALEMIFNGECGQFNPEVLDAMREAADTLRDRIEQNSSRQDSLFDAQEISNEIIGKKDSLSERTITLLEEERTKYQFLAALSNEIIVDYDVLEDVVTFSEKGTSELDLPLSIQDFSQNTERVKAIQKKALYELWEAVKKSNPANPIIQEQYLLRLPGGESAWYEIILRSMWTRDITPRLKGVIGKIVNINDQMIETKRLENLAARDSLTNLYNRAAAQQLIEQYLKNCGKQIGAYIFLDVDNFKEINDANGHVFGDGVLRHVAEIITDNVRSGDVAARIGGDEFVVFLKNIDSRELVEKQAQRIYNAFAKQSEDHVFSVSMGIAMYPEDGRGFEELTDHADRALLEAKRAGKNACVFYG